MDIFVTEKLFDLLIMGTTFSIFEMALVQKFKALSFFNSKTKVWFLNFVLSIFMGIPFTMYFFSIGLTDAIWTTVFGFIGAPTIYGVLKKQNIINYTPKSCNKTTCSIPVENEIKRGDSK